MINRQEHRGAGSADEIPTVLAEQVRDDRLVRASGCVFSSPTEFELLSFSHATNSSGRIALHALDRALPDDDRYNDAVDDFGCQLDEAALLECSGHD
jgi:hypothetical protein